MRLLLLLTLATGINASACSAIVLKGKQHILLAKNFDWTYRNGILIKNLRGVTKTAYLTHNGEQATWTSKHGSVTFNQNGKDMPYGGMNEAGLVVEMLWLELTQYNLNDNKPYVNELEWIQYQLDNFSTVQEVLSRLSELKVYPVKGKIHYMLTDALGESAIIEFLNGKPVSYKKEANVCQAITNHAVIYSEPYKNQIKNIRKNNTAPTFRYYQLEQAIAQLPNRPTVNEALAFAILKRVTIPKGEFKTMWSIVYNIKTLTISFLTDTHTTIKNLEISKLNFNTDLQFIDLNQNTTVNLNGELKVLTEAINFSVLSPPLIQLGFDEELTRDISRHQFSINQQTTSVFQDRYFHFEIIIPAETERQTGFLAVIDSEMNFQFKKAVAGGFLYGTINKDLVVHIYGLRSARYSLVSFIDTNKNRNLDFDKRGPVERYASFANRTFQKESDVTFLNTSAEFTRANAKVELAWR